MSVLQKITLIGAYNMYNQFERDLFELLTLPEGYDKTTFVNTLLLEHGEKPILYTDPDFMYQAIGIWASKYSLELERIYEALTAEYNPIWNYDRNEEWEDHSGRKYESTVNAGHKATDSPKYDVTTNQTVQGTTEHQISADNSSTYQPEAKDITNAGTVKQSTEGKTQDLSESSNSKQSDSETNNSGHSGHLWGNIGVTTSAQMVTEVVKQRFQITLYGTVTQMFANELLIGMY